MALESTGEAGNRSPDDKSRELSLPSRVNENVRSFTVEERRRLAEFFILLDRMDRAHAARCERKAA